MITFDPDIVGPWVCEKAGGSYLKGRGTAIGRIKDQLIAGVLYEDFNQANVVCHIRGEPGWATKGFLSLIFDYPFNQLKVKRITTPVNSTNSKSIQLVEHMGFTLECRLAKATPDGDMLIYRMFREECKYLGEPYGQSLNTCGT